MKADWYMLLAMALRYFFAVLAVIILIRAGKITLQDNSRAKVLRSWAPHTGAIGELVIIRGNARYKKGTRIPVPKEGLLGTAYSSDIRIRHVDVNRYHAHVEQRENGILLTACGQGQIKINGQIGDRVLVRDREKFSIGSLDMQFLLHTESPSSRIDAEESSLFSPPGVHAGSASGKAASSARKAEKRGRKASERVETLFLPFDDEEMETRTARKK